MEPPSSSSFTAPPPVGGLGNFKGVMLCNRPADEPTKHMGGGGADGDFQPPFKPTISSTHGEQIGINPCRKFEKSDVKTCGPSAALKRHVRWLRELQQQMKEERDQVEDDDKMAIDRKEKMKVVFEKQRETVRQMMSDRDNVQREHLESAISAKPKAKTKAKPLWAMTVQEKDEFEEDEATDLINFAENLDFDKYVGDLEFRQNLEAMKDRAGKLQKVQDAFKDQLLHDLNGPENDDDRSTSVGGSCRDLEDGIEGSQLGDGVSESGRAKEHRRRNREGGRGAGGDDWDTSTCCGDDRPFVDDATKDAVDRILENAPALKGIHSKESLAKIIEREKRTRGDLDLDLDGSKRLNEHMRKEGAAAVAPVIVASEDTQNKLHKPVDPSQLPYLYRSPAV